MSETMRVALTGVAVCVSLTFWWGCDDDPSDADGDVDADGDSDVDADVDADGDTDADADADADSGGPCPGVPCPVGQLCYEGGCVRDMGECTGNGDCQSDSFCSDGHCIPYGPETRTFDPECTYDGFVADELEEPVISCSWTESAVVMNPVVIDLDGPGGDDLPEVVFVDSSGDLIALSPVSCEELWRRTAGLHTHAHLAAADLTGDGVPELVGVTTANALAFFDNDGQQLAISDPALGGAPGGRPCSGAAIADVDGVAPPEIGYAGMMVRYEGGEVTTLFNTGVPNAELGLLSAIADVDHDGTPEMVVGNRIFDGLTGEDETPPGVSSFPAGYVAIADFDRTTETPEVVLVSSQAHSGGDLRIYDPVTGDVVFGPYRFTADGGGPPTVGDFDGDGEPEVGAAGANSYTLFDLECAVEPLPEQCAAPGIRWTRTTIDLSSATGSSVFDFNGDEQAEVVYRDECWLNVYDGITGLAHFALPITNGTCTETVLIADVDNDAHAEIVVASYPAGGSAGYICTDHPDLGLPHGGQLEGVFILEDPEDRWMPSRAIWNQHTYHITNIEDDGTIPEVEERNWETWNNYRQNVQGEFALDVPGPDFTGREQWTYNPDSDCVERWVLQAELCNRGLADIPAGIQGTFYIGDPRSGGQSICTAATTEPLPSGECQMVSCEWLEPDEGVVDLWFVADDNGAGLGSEIECEEANNMLHMPEEFCPGGAPD